VRSAWHDVYIANVDSTGIPQQAQAGDTLQVRASVHLDGLAAEDVAVELVAGHTDEDDRLAPGYRSVRLTPSGEEHDGLTVFTCSQPLTATGTFGYTVRVVPSHPQLVSPVELGLVTYAS